MSKHFYTVFVDEIKRETADCISIKFKIPEDLKSIFQYQHGQSLNLRTTINGEEVRRTYSLCSSPLDNEWRIAVKVLENGVFSNYANEKLKPGDALEAMEPVGKFTTELNITNKKNYLAFAAGSGITPIISIIKTTLRTEPKSNFTLVYGNRDRSAIIFFDELEALKNTFIDRFNIIYILSREHTEIDLNYGHIDESKLIELGKAINYNSIDDTFICGPRDMIFSVKDFLEAKGTDKKKIHFEIFISTSPAKTTTAKQTASVETGKQSNITIKSDGRSFDFKMPLNGTQSILDGALTQGADLPYACKGGMCCTCKAKLLDGEVAMDVHWGLEDDEVAKGYILTCQSHPKSKNIVIDFDDK